MKQNNLFSFLCVICFLFLIMGCSDFFGGNITTDLKFSINLSGLTFNSRNVTQANEVAKITVELKSQDNSVSLKQEQNIIDNNVGLFTFNDIKVGTVINIVASIYLGEKEIYHGETDWQTVKPNDNQFSLTLEKIFYEPVKVTLTFDSNGGTDVSSISGVEGEKITSPAAPTKEGYAFVGWEPELPDVFPSEDTLFTASWIANTQNKFIEVTFTSYEEQTDLFYEPSINGNEIKFTPYSGYTYALYLDDVLQEEASTSLIIDTTNMAGGLHTVTLIATNVDTKEMYSAEYQITITQ